MKILILKAIRMQPTQVITDSDKLFKAIYTDDIGSYEFSVKKKKGKFFVRSAGVDLYSTKSAEHLIWDFESQLADVNPKVFV